MKKASWILRKLFGLITTCLVSSDQFHSVTSINFLMGNILSEYIKNFLKNDGSNHCTVKRSDSAEHLIFEDTFGRRMTKICLLNCSCKLKSERKGEDNSNDKFSNSKLDEEVSYLRKELAETKSIVQSLEGLIKDLSTKVEISLNRPVVQQGIPPPPPPPPPPNLAVPTTMPAFTVPVTPIKSAKKGVQNSNKSLCRMVVTLEDLQNVKLKKTPLPSKRLQDNEKKEDNFLLRPPKRKKLDM